MFEDLSEKLEATFARLRGRGVLTEADIKEGLREVRRVLLEADVNFQLTREFLERVENKAKGITALTTVSPGQQLVKAVHEELIEMLGERREGLKLGTVPPSVIMMVGLQGSGKTTTAAKLARKLKAEGRSTRLIAAGTLLESLSRSPMLWLVSMSRIAREFFTSFRSARFSSPKK